MKLRLGRFVDLGAGFYERGKRGREASCPYCPDPVIRSIIHAVTRISPRILWMLRRAAPAAYRAKNHCQKHRLIRMPECLHYGPVFRCALPADAPIPLRTSLCNVRIRPSLVCVLRRGLPAPTGN